MLIYLDHNEIQALASASEDDPERTALRQLVAAGKQPVISLWNVAEIALRLNEKAVPIAEFVMRQPFAWLRDRISIRREEVKATFFGKAFPRPKAVLGTFAGALVDLGNSDEEAAKVSVVDFVKRGIRNPQWFDKLLGVKLGHPAAHSKIRDGIADGKLTDEVRARLVRSLVEAYVPTESDGGIIVPTDAREQYLRRFDPNTCPTVAMELAYFEARHKIRIEE